MIVNAIKCCIDLSEIKTVIIGDRMDTDIIAGIETECETILVLSGVTKREDIRKYGYKPTLVLNGIGEIPSL